MILQKNYIKNYKRYIDNMFMNREIELGTDNNFMKNSNCLKCICENHNKL